MKKYLTNAVLLLSTSLLTATHAHDDRQQDRHTLQRLHQDAKNTVFGMVATKDLQSLCVSCPQMRSAVGRYQQHHVLPRLLERVSSAPSHQAVADRYCDYWVEKNRRANQSGYSWRDNKAPTGKSVYFSGNGLSLIVVSSNTSRFEPS